jgi:hypothetical protein
VTDGQGPTGTSTTQAPAEAHSSDAASDGVGPPGRRIGVADLGWAGLAALCAMGIALAFRSALVPTDPWHYVQGALAFPEGTWRPAGLSRWGFLLPIVPFASWWGDATATYYVLPLLTTGLLAAVLYLLGTRLAGRAAGALGSLLALGTPLVLVNLTRGYPDLTATALVGAAILLATLAEDAAGEARARGQRWGWRVPVLLLATGFVTGWSVEVRETAVFAWPVVGWILWRIRRPVATLAWSVPPVIAWLVLDLALCAWVYDDPLLKLRVITGADISTSEVGSDAGYVGQSRWWYVTILPRSLWALSGGPSLTVLLVAGLVGGFLLRAQLGRIWAWGVLALGLLWLQGGPLSPDHPSVRLDVARYWPSFIVPLVLTAVCSAAIVVRSTRGSVRVVSAVAAGVVGLGSLIPMARFATSYPGFAPNGGDAMSELRDHLAGTQEVADVRIWADWGTQRVLPAYQVGPFGDPRWTAAGFRSFNRLLRAPEVRRKWYPKPGEYVVLYSATDRTCWHCRRALAPAEEAFGPFPGPGWVEVFTSSAGTLTLYRLGASVEWPPAPSPIEAAPEDGADEPL